MKCTKSPKIILVPFPAQGHVTPMLKLATAFLDRGFEPVMVTPEFIHRRIVPRIELGDGISCVSMPDGLDEETPRDFFAIETAMENTMPIQLDRLVHQLNENGSGVVCVVVDLLASWAIKVANLCGIPAAGFWPAMLASYCSIAAIPDMVRTGLISETGIPRQVGTVRFQPGQPAVSTEDLPWLIGSFAARKSRFKFWTRTLDRSRSLRWLLVNSFSLECDESIESSKDHPLVVPVGALCTQSATKNPSFWEEDASCLDWLDKQKACSVTYVSFGSWVSPIGEAKLKNLALALEASRRPFLWVLAPKWRDGLPVGYLDRVSRQAKVVSWAPQIEVLQHKSVGCYLTHCGWNSTMEAIQCQKRLVCYPVAGDQFLNCAYIVEVWKIGVKINGFAQRDIEEGLRTVMEDDEMGNRLTRLKERTMGGEAASGAVANLTVFIDDLKKLIAESPIRKPFD